MKTPSLDKNTKKTLKNYNIFYKDTQLLLSLDNVNFHHSSLIIMFMYLYKMIKNLATNEASKKFRILNTKSDLCRSSKDSKMRLHYLNDASLISRFNLENKARTLILSIRTSTI